MEEAQKTFVETVAPLLIRQHSLDPSGPWLLVRAASRARRPRTSSSPPLGNARAMGWLADFPRARRPGYFGCRPTKRPQGACVLFVLGRGDRRRSSSHRRRRGTAVGSLGRRCRDATTRQRRRRRIDAQDCDVIAGVGTSRSPESWGKSDLHRGKGRKGDRSIASRRAGAAFSRSTSLSAFVGSTVRSTRVATRPRPRRCRSSHRCPGSAATQSQDRGADLANFFIFSSALTVCVFVTSRTGFDL